MKANYNGKLLEYHDVMISPADRGFRYGDGLFETMAVVNGHVRLLEEHYARIAKGAQIFELDISNLRFDNFSGYCDELIQYYSGRALGKMRFHLWRSGGGLYTPRGHAINFLFTIQNQGISQKQEIMKVDFCESIQNFPSSFSFLKTSSASKYVLAGLEKKRKSLQEIILLDHNGFVSETVDSNIFMKRDGKYITPPLSTGCVAGVMRHWIVDRLKKCHIPTEEKLVAPHELLRADSIFTSNAMGVQHILKIGEATFSKDQKIQEILLELN